MTDETKNNITNPNVTRHHHLTPAEIKEGCVEIYTTEDGVRLCRVQEELKQGMTEMEAYDQAVTFYGSARFKEGDEYYDKARNLASRIVKELNLTIVTGGGPGIMEGGNRGAFEAGGKSVGAAIQLPMEQKDNPYLTDSVPFYFFFARRVALSFSSKVFIYFPGGFGTLDELFEVVTLLQTKKLKSVPIILYGSDFWKPLMEGFARPVMLNKFKTISPEDMNLFTITDDDDLVIDMIKKAPPRAQDNRLD
ncbi:MAG: TIGR00730 family Rossman fold protein [bacterium]